MYDTTQTKSLFKNIQQQPLSTDPLSFIGKESVEIRTIVPEDEIELPDQATIQRIEECKLWFTYFSPRNGKPVSARNRCRCYEWCQVCRSELVERELYRFSEIDGPVYKTEIDDRDWSTVSKYLSRNEVNYRRYPQVGGSSVLFIEQDISYFPQLERVSEMTSEELDVLIQRKPNKSRISGKLGGRLATPNDDNDDDSESVQVFVPFNCTDADYDTQKEARLAAIENTKHLDPDGDTVQDAIDERTKAYVDALKKAGAQIISTVTKPMYVRTAAISWKDSNYSDIGMIPLSPTEAPIPF